MNKITKNKKIFIIIIIGLALIILIASGIFLFIKNNDAKEQNNEITNNYVAYISINPLIKLEYSQTCNEKKCDNPIVIKYELVNDDAKNIYKDVDLIGTNRNLYDVITLISKTADENNIEFENVEIYSNWDNLNNYIENSDKGDYKWSYIINIRDKENLEDISSALEENKILYNIEFDTNGGNEIITQTVEKGKLANQPTTPTKKGYKFIEWQLNGEKFNFKQEIDSDIKLIAKWEKIETSNNNSNKNENNTKPNNNTNNNDNNDNNNSANNNPANNNPDNNEGGLGDAGGQGDYIQNFCEEDFNSEECIDSLLEFYNDGKVVYDNKVLWSTQGITLKRCYDAYSCVNTLTVTIYNYNTNNINSIPSTHKKYIYNYFSISDFVSEAQSNYNNVVKHNYVQSFETYLNNLETILNKYEDYKNQGLIQNDDSTIPENLQECIKDTIGVDICLRTINTVKGEISWTQDGLANAKSDLNYASQALNSSKELFNLFN